MDNTATLDREAVQATIMAGDDREALALLADRFRVAREQCKESRSGLAESAGITRGYVWSFEKGRQSISALHLGRLCFHLGLSIDYLFGLSDDPVLVGERDRTV